MVKENGLTEASYRLQGSVPFDWEEKPGTPKKEWKTCEPIPPNLVASPAKLSVSVPFKWEEKPGKPLFQFSQTKADSPVLSLPPATPVVFPSPSTHPPIHSNLSTMFPKRSNPFACDDEEEDREGDFADADDENEDDRMLELDLETFVFNIKSPSSAPSLLANRLMTTTMVSSAVPVHVSLARGSSSSHQSSAEEESDQHENWAFSASDADSNSTAYNSAGDSVLEFLFPLFSPDSGFLDKVSHSDKDLTVVTSPELLVKHNTHESQRSLVVRKTRTLGELIQMSRRMSCARKQAVNNRRRSRSRYKDKEKCLSYKLFWVQYHMGLRYFQWAGQKLSRNSSVLQEHSPAASPVPATAGRPLDCTSGRLHRQQ